jgi:hypothetical protein
MLHVYQFIYHTNALVGLNQADFKALLLLLFLRVDTVDMSGLQESNYTNKASATIRIITYSLKPTVVLKYGYDYQDNDDIMKL